MPELTTRYQLFYNTLESQALTYEEILSVLLGFLYFSKHIFGARAERDCPYGDVFFFADFVTCANFSNLCGKFLKTHNRYGHHVSAKSCAGSWATFSSKKNFEKIRLHGFF